MSNAACMAPTVSALAMAHGQLELALDLVLGPADPRRPRPKAGSRTSSKVTTENRRVRSTVCIGRHRDAGACPAGTSTWVSPVRVATGDQEMVGPAADSTGRFTPLSTTSSPSVRISKATLAESARSGAAR